MEVLVHKTVKLKDLEVPEVDPDEDGEIDCASCGDPVGFFDSQYILEDDTTYMVCSRCGAVYKSKE